jgi:hypothetical protein
MDLKTAPKLPLTAQPSMQVHLLSLMISGLMVFNTVPLILGYTYILM